MVILVLEPNVYELLGPAHPYHGLQVLVRIVHRESHNPELLRLIYGFIRSISFLLMKYYWPLMCQFRDRLFRWNCKVL
jgi:hypothetical protein